MKHFSIIILVFAAMVSKAQNKFIYKGNESYHNRQYNDAVQFYGKALEADKSDSVALFNLGNALFRDKKDDEAILQFENLSKSSVAWYNKGVVYTHQKKLPESIAAYKQALRINPDDALARENLQRALQEQKQKNEQQQKNDQKKKEPEKQDNKLTKQQVEQLLKALEEQEKKLQNKLQKSRVASPGQPEKDW